MTASVCPRAEKVSIVCTGVVSPSDDPSSLTDLVIELDPVFLSEIGAPIAALVSGRTRAVANDAFWAVFGYDPEVDTVLSLDQLGPPESRGQVRDALTPLLRGEKNRVSLIKEFTRKDGTMFAGRVQASARLDDGGASHVTVSFTEVPRDQTASIPRLGDDAETNNTAFVASVGHELRSPLHSILGLAELLADDEHLAPADHELALAILDQTAALSRLVDDLLDYSTMYGSTVSLDFAAESPAELTQAIIRLLAPRAEAAGSRIVGVVDPGTPPSIVTDGLRVRQVLTNLVTNAIRYGGPGTITLTVDSPESDQLRFVVSDEGPGIPPHIRDNIFEPFVRGEKRSQGSGLGLAITKRLVTMLGGSITVTSVPNAGATFTVLLPMSSPPPGDRRPRRARSSPSQTTFAPHPGRHRVLVVEDEEVNQLLATSQLTKLGFLVDVADDGESALEMIETSVAEERPYAAALMDWHLPGIDGVETTRRIRRIEEDHPERLPLPIIGVTANALPRDRDTCLDAGMDEFLAKPVGIAGLSEALQRWVCPISLHDDGPLLDLTILTSLSDELGDESAVVTLLTTFISELPARLEPLETVIAGADVEPRDLHRAVHSLKSTTALIGSPRISDACALLESRLDLDQRPQDRPSARNDFRAVVHLLRVLANEVSQAIGGAQSGSTAIR